MHASYWHHAFSVHRTHMCNSNTHYIAEYTSGRTYSSFFSACHFQQLLNNQHPLPWSRESVALSHRSSHTEASVGIIRTAEDTTPSMVIYIYISLTPFHSIFFPIPPPTITPPPNPNSIITSSSNSLSSTHISSLLFSTVTQYVANQLEGLLRSFAHYRLYSCGASLKVRHLQHLPKSFLSWASTHKQTESVL